MIKQHNAGVPCDYIVFIAFSLNTPLAPFWIEVVSGVCCPSSGLRVGLQALCLVHTRRMKRPQCYILSLIFSQL